MNLKIKENIFNKLNIVDGFIMVLIIFLIPAIHYGFRMNKIYYLYNKTEERSCIVVFSGIPDSQLSNIQEGDAEVSRSVLLKAQLIKILHIKKKLDSNDLYATLKFRVRNHGQNNIYYEDILMAHNAPIMFRGPTYTLKGHVLLFPQIDYMEDSSSNSWNSIKYKVLFINVRGFVLNKIEEGDIEIKHQGKAMVQIIRITKKYPHVPLNFFGVLHLNPLSDMFFHLEAWLLLKGKIPVPLETDLYNSYLKKNIIIFEQENYTLEGIVLEVQPDNQCIETP